MDKSLLRFLVDVPGFDRDIRSVEIEQKTLGAYWPVLNFRVAQICGMLAYDAQASTIYDDAVTLIYFWL
ncbi:MAG: hypothetical protein M3Q16_07690 [Pseudomonadota bacterium]|nr:hypothetical protein [Pseudomonadota bacterium]